MELSASARTGGVLTGRPGGAAGARARGANSHFSESTPVRCRQVGCLAQCLDHAAVIRCAGSGEIEILYRVNHSTLGQSLANDCERKFIQLFTGGARMRCKT